VFYDSVGKDTWEGSLAVVKSRAPLLGLATPVNHLCYLSCLSRGSFDSGMREEHSI
jgi:hypothetical protein